MLTKREEKKESCISVWKRGANHDSKKFNFVFFAKN
jgi:hypothetical protein